MGRYAVLSSNQTLLSFGSALLLKGLERPSKAVALPMRPTSLSENRSRSFPSTSPKWAALRASASADVSCRP